MIRRCMKQTKLSTRAKLQATKVVELIMMMTRNVFLCKMEKWKGSCCCPLFYLSVSFRKRFFIRECHGAVCRDRETDKRRESKKSREKHFLWCEGASFCRSCLMAHTHFISSCLPYEASYHCTKIAGLPERQYLNSDRLLAMPSHINLTLYVFA